MEWNKYKHPTGRQKKDETPQEKQKQDHSNDSGATFVERNTPVRDK